MKNKVISLVSFGVVAILLMLPMNSSIGYTAVKNEERTNPVPLFKIQLKRALRESSSLSMQTSFIGKDKEVTIALPTLQDLPSWLDKVVEKLREKPELLDLALARILGNHKLMDALEKARVGKAELLSMVNRLKNNPALLKEGIIKAMRVNPEIGLLLNRVVFPEQKEQTANIIECLVSAIIALFVIPYYMALVFIIVIATVTIIGCIGIMPVLEEYFKLLERLPPCVCPTSSNFLPQ